MSDRQDMAKEAALAEASPKIQIVCADAGLAGEYRAELDRDGAPPPCAVVSSPAEAHRLFEQAGPLVTLLDESSVPAGDSLESAVALLAGAAPVVVVAAPERRWELAFLTTSGAADFVPRSGSFVSAAAARVEQRVRLAALAADPPDLSDQEFAGNFGEIFRHEVNNELTGILGNAELLLGRRDRLPPDALERLKTIAQLAVRVRETVRRLSHAWDLWQRQPRPSPAAPSLALSAPGAANPPAVTSQWRSNDARRSTTLLASVPRMPPPPGEPEPQGPGTRPGAAVARWDSTWRTRKG